MQIETTLGRFVLELNAERAPLTVNHFVKYTRDRFYDGTVFHRVLEDSLIQGGAYMPDLVIKSADVQPGVTDESHNELHNVRGTVALVRVPNRPNVPTPQFFINVSDNPSLDTPHGSGETHTVFGKVVEGMDTVDLIGRTRTGPHPNYAAGNLPVVPTAAVVITRARLITPYDPRDAAKVVEARKAEEQRIAADVVAAKAQVLADRIEGIEKKYGKMTTTESGLKYVDIRQGTGPIPMIDDTVEMHYRVELLDHTLADTSYEGESRTTTIRRMKPGVQEGFLSMREGGKRCLVVPSELAFAGEGVGGRIPPNAIVFYEVELLSIE